MDTRSKEKGITDGLTDGKFNMFPETFDERFRLLNHDSACRTDADLIGQGSEFTVRFLQFFTDIDMLRAVFFTFTAANTL